MDKMSVYNRLPVWGQNIACFIEGNRIKRTRYGKTFWRLLADYEARSKWSYEQLCDYRNAKLRKIIHHCYDTVPYYRRLFNERGINPDSIKTLEDLKVLPILTKKIVNANPNDFLSSVISQDKMITAHTSGTTGSGFVFKTTQEAICEQWAVWWRYRRALGIEYGTWSANFGTRFIVPRQQDKPPFWRYNAPCHQIYFSAFHENNQNLGSYVNEIVNKNIRWIHGYPSLLALLANYILSNKINLSGQIDYVTIGAESLLEHQKRLLTEAFGVKPYQHYGLSEGIANFSENKNGEIIVDEDFAAVEFLYDSKAGTNRIIGTTLTNYAMPLLRWDTKDTASVTENLNKGRLVTSIDGRVEDYISLPDGTKIGKLDHVFKDTIHLREVQIHQNKNGSLTIFATTDGTDVSSDITLARRILTDSIGDILPVEFKIVTSISSGKNGKLRFVTSEYNNDK